MIFNSFVRFEFHRIGEIHIIYPELHGDGVFTLCSIFIYIHQLSLKKQEVLLNNY